MNVNEFIVYLI